MKTKSKVPEPVALILLISLDSSLITKIGLEILAPAAAAFSPVLGNENQMCKEAKFIKLFQKT